MLIDTDVLIWYMKGNKKAWKLVYGQQGFSISVVTYIELVQGLRNKEEWTELQKAIRSWQVTVLHLDERISSKAQFYIDSYFLSHSLRLADALIAATAVEHNLELCSANEKHYKAVPNLNFRKFRP
jgi:predicted nucleic acid-binding protein